MASRKNPNKKQNQDKPTLSIGAKQVGSAISLYNTSLSYGWLSGPDRDNWVKYERAVRRDYIIFRGLQFQIQTMLASLGAYTHSNPKVQTFVQSNLDTAEGNLHKWLEELMWSALIYGRGTSETLWEVRDDNKIYLKDMVSYHPRSIYLVVDHSGRLTDGKKDPYHQVFPKTGVWQEIPSKVLMNRARNLGRDKFLSYVRLPKDKVCIVSHNSRFGNLDGESALAPIWDTYQRKLKTRDDLMITAERYGAPQVAAIVPYALTANVVEDPITNLPRKETLAEATARSLSNSNTSTAMVIEEPPLGTTQEKVRLQTLTTGNNFGDSYLNVLHEFDSEILIGLGVPPLLFLEQKQGLGSGTLSATQADYYKQTLVTLFKEFVEPFTEQVIGRLVKLNFGIDDYGHFEFNPFDIASAEKFSLIMVAGAELGIFDFSQAEDLQKARVALGFPQLSEKDLKERLSKNKESMANARNRDRGKIKIAEMKNRTQESIAEGNREAQLKAAKLAAKAASERASQAASKPKPKPK